MTGLPVAQTMTNENLHNFHSTSAPSLLGSGKFLGLVSQPQKSRLGGEMISQTFPRPSVSGQKVSLSMWYYTEGWTEKNLYLVIQSSTANQTMLTNLDRQSRRWNHLKIEVLVNTTFKVKYTFIHSRTTLSLSTFNPLSK